MTSLKTLVAKAGSYKLYRGKLAKGDSRSHFAENGAAQPVASFWNEGDGIRWLRDNVADKVTRVALKGGE